MKKYVCFACALLLLTACEKKEDDSLFGGEDPKALLRQQQAEEAAAKKAAEAAQIEEAAEEVIEAPALPWRTTLVSKDGKDLPCTVLARLPGTDELLIRSDRNQQEHLIALSMLGEESLELAKLIPAVENEDLRRYQRRLEDARYQELLGECRAILVGDKSEESTQQAIRWFRDHSVHYRFEESKGHTGKKYLREWNAQPPAVSIDGVPLGRFDAEAIRAHVLSK